MRKAFNLLESTIIITIVALLIIAASYFKRESKSNNIKGAQLSIMKIYETQKLYYKENKKYTDDLNILWKYHKRIPEYPVTIVDVRKRTVNKEKEPILYFRIDHYYLKVKTSENGQKFIIEAEVPTADKFKLPKFTVNQDQELSPKEKDLWLIKIEKKSK